jgi:hypothetical protein
VRVVNSLKLVHVIIILDIGLCVEVRQVRVYTAKTACYVSSPATPLNCLNIFLGEGEHGSVPAVAALAVHNRPGPPGWPGSRTATKAALPT